MNLIKEIMLQAEEDDADSKVKGYDRQIVLNHKKMLIDAGFLQGTHHINSEGAKPIVGFVDITDITWEGYDFLELLKDDEKFAYLKDIAKKMPLEAIKMGMKLAYDELIKG